MTRVALLPSAYLPALGGVEELTRHLALALTEAGDEVEVWTGLDRSSGLAEVETLDGLTVRRFELVLPASAPGALARFPLGRARTLAALRRATEEFRPELLHVQCFGPNGVYASALALRRRLPLVVTLQGETMMDDQDIYEHSLVLRAALRRALSRADAVTACSRFTLEDAVRRFGYPPGQGRVIFNGVGPGAGDAGDEVAGNRPGGGPGEAGRYVFAVGRVVHKKGFDLLLRAFAEISATHPDVTLVIGGEGERLPALRQLAEELGLGARARFVGRLSREQVAATMAGAEAFVMPSRLEPFGIVALEGWRAGAPLVATSRGGAPEYVREGEDGLLVDPFDTGALAGTLDRLLSDEALARRIGEAGRVRVGQFSWPAIADQYREVYARVLAARAGS